MGFPLLDLLGKGAGQMITLSLIDQANKAGLDGKQREQALLTGLTNPNPYAGAVAMQDYIKGVAANKAKVDKDTADANKAAQEEAANKAANAEATETQSSNAGLSKASSGLLGETAAEATETNLNNVVQHNRDIENYNQSEYLKQMNGLLNLQQDKNNLNSQEKWNNIGSAISGGASGLSLGLAMSDEDNKETPDRRLNYAIALFRKLEETRCSQQ